MVGRRAASTTLLAFLVTGCTSTQAAPVPAAMPVEDPPAVTSTAIALPPSSTLTVQSIVDVRTVTLSDGARIQVAGLAAPGECWAADGAAFATSMLLGKDVRVTNGNVLKLTDGTDYALLAVGQGAARAEAPTGVMLDAQNAAQQTPLGLWAPPCRGEDKTSTPPPPPPPPAPPKPTTTTPRPVFFLTCDEARRAGAAPIRSDQPGYRLQLDPNRNGIACE
ncbi:hypothetical protein Lesp02_51290 [Lentzea sp. NBRC 105346]|uniref:thermonuclease family protein n=1 Tax=Lentzea sp. NBRC 105346 TaxID=3032205 RepID=UPI0024A0F11A|nr:excalibur calcium-binding domain-containing protein [Lentzea sp. NBRC 105346]GLZ32941.1 hypothetical protein Lesp02_51290 [Lentzea sp. NBRC 105346]